MKKYFSLFFALFAVVCLALTSCSKDDEDSTLTLSTTTCTFTNAESEQAITVNTNQDSWNAIANANWVKTEVSGNTLTIKVSANTTTKDRTAEVLVVAGSSSQKISVTQSAAEVTLVAVPDRLNVKPYAKAYTFDVNANSKDWGVTTDADWLTAEAKTYKSEVVVMVKDNPEITERTAKLLLTVKGKTVKEFVVRQEGKIYYILPYLKPFAKKNEIVAFERDRRSEQDNSLGAIVSGNLVFETESPVFPQVQYKLSQGSHECLKAILMAKTKDELKNENGAIKLLVENGFVKEKDGAYVKESSDNVTHASFLSNSKGNGIIFTFTPKQKAAQPTFNSFPYGLIDFNADSARVEEYERSIGGKRNKDYEQSGDKMKTMFFEGDGENSFGRMYSFPIKNKVLQPLDGTLQFLYHPEKVFFEAHDNTYVTNEFAALTAQEGFQFVGINSDGNVYVYKNPAKHLAMGVSLIELDQKVIKLLLAPIPASASNAQTMSIVKKQIKLKTEQRHRRH